MAAGERRPVDAFILFNESEKQVPTIVDHLEAEGISTYFWRRDIEVGEDFIKSEGDFIRSAKTVVVFLGSAGWGPTQSTLARQAQQLERRILPVLIGDPPSSAFDEIGGLFRRLRYVDLRTESPKEFDLLISSIKSSLSTSDLGGSLDTSKFDGIVQAIVDGDESDRLSTVHQVSSLSEDDRTRLGKRLRIEIQTRYGVESQTTFASTPRTPGRIASIRSWLLSCLISADCESPETKSLVQDHLSESAEPENTVRYWALAQLYAVKASYLNSAAESALGDRAGEIRLMARAILSPDDQQFLLECRTRLADPDFKTAWEILRVLRAIPIPTLVPDVCVQFRKSEVGTPLSYDSLSALCSPPMAQVASSLLIEEPGIAATVNRVIAEAGLADKVAADRFAWFLISFPFQAVSGILESAMLVPSTRIGAELLRNALLRIQGSELANISISGYSNDSNDIAHDYLDIREDVQTLAAVMLARDVKPPLAIGLFGDWGTGKSFFMDSLRATTDRMAELNEPHLCSNVVSISFNAWHYADTNLWASMVSFILERLSDYLAPEQSFPEQEESFLGQLASAKAVVDAAQLEKQTTETLINARASELENAKRDREQKEIKLRDLKAGDFKQLLEGDPDLKRSITEALIQMGIPSLLESEEQLSAVVAESANLANRVSVVAASFASAGNVWLVIALVLLVLFGIPWLGDFLRDRVASGAFVGVGVVVGQIASALIVAARIVGTAIGKVRSGVATISQAKDKIDKLMAEKHARQSTAELKLQSEIAALRAKEAESSARLKAATAHVAELEDRIALTKRARSLEQFLIDRTKSDDYRKYLGLISVIRHDFDVLADRLQLPPKGDGITKPVDRIVLYVDDLDRCPEEKVLEVLQAVHLLLAYPLFVVVVGVDPRWLAHSLKYSFRALRRSRAAMNSDELIQATPQNYLEKIFQIPFSLRPMSSTGYVRLIGSLFASDRSAADKRVHLIESRTSEIEKQSMDSRVPLEPISAESPSGGTQEGVESRNEGRFHEGRESEASIIVDREALSITPWETAFATRLFALIPTPRSTKRFANIYRLLKAPVPRNRLLEFEGTEALPGEFRVPMTLLAVLIGNPEAARSLFPAMYAAVQASESPLEVLRNSKWEAGAKDEIAVVLKNITPIVSDSAFPSDPAAYAFWIPRVSRFSFDLTQSFAQSR
jgi:KAP family P-loop domain.